MSVILITIALLILSAFFVVVEFALLGARRHRLEDLAVESRSARAALRGMNDLTLMLAGSQLGITICTFALGAITKPAVNHWFHALFGDLGIPDWIAGSASFGVALFLVTFLHLIVGEMAPKSWAIANPERSALVIGIPARVYLWCVRPLMRWVNYLANSLVRASGVEPVESAAVGGRDVATIRHLVEHSAEVGTLEPEVQQQISALIDMGTLPVEQLIKSGMELTYVPFNATVADVRKAAERSGHLRILMMSSERSVPLVVHLRDTLLEPDSRPAREIARKVLLLDRQTPVYESLARMRKAKVQLAVVMHNGVMRGVVTLSDILPKVLPAMQAYGAAVKK